MLVFGIDTRKIVLVWITVWVSILHVEQENEIVPIFDRV
jgi:hypothetical protein